MVEAELGVGHRRGRRVDRWKTGTTQFVDGLVYPLQVGCQRRNTQAGRSRSSRRSARSGSLSSPPGRAGRPPVDPHGLSFSPPNVARELRDRTLSFNAAVRDSVRDYDPVGPRPRASSIRSLAHIDPRLLMARARDQIVPGLPMKPGYYHVICDNSERGAPDR